MRIGIDCRPLIKEKTGIGYYLWEILSAWAESPFEHELWLYAPRDFQIPPKLMEAGIPVCKRVVRVRPAELWMHTVLPMQLALDQIEVYWGPNYAMPLWNVPIPTVLTVHDTVYREFPETMKQITLWHNRLGLETYVRHCDLILTPSEHTKKDVIRHLHVSPEQIVVTPLGVSSRISPVTEQAQNQIIELGIANTPFFLAVGTLEPRKNLNAIVQSFSIAKETLPEAHLVIVGTKGWGTTGEEVASVNDPSIHYLGYVSDEVLSALYQLAKVFVFVPLYEGFGLPPLEAMKAKTPVLVSNTSSLPEVVGECGLYADPYHTEEIVQGMIRLWCDESLRATLVEAAYKRALQMSWKITADETLRVLESLEKGWIWKV